MVALRSITYGTVMDCRWYVKPDIIEAQVEGAIVMALGAANIQEITFKDGLA